MNDRIQNRLNMLNACLTLAHGPAHRAVWDGKEPLAFGEDLAALKTDLAATVSLAAQLGGALPGASDAKDEAETALEDAAYLVVTGMRSFYKKTGATEALGKINFSKSHLQRLRDAQLVADAAAILAAAQSAVTQPEAVKRGVTPAAVSALSAALAAYDALLAKPRTNQVSRNTLLRELTTRIGAHLEAIAGLDDLVLHFGATAEGRRFIDAWQSARVIIDAGASPAGDEEPTAATPATPAAPPKSGA